MSDNGIQLVIFDLGGVLIRLCNGWEHACQLAEVTPAKPMTDWDMHQLIELVQREEVSAFEHGEFYHRAAPLMGMTPQQALAISNVWLRGAYPGIDGLIDTLHDAGRRTACLSNTNDNHWRAMTDPDHPNALPLDKLHHRFASHLIRDRKPNPTIYQYVEQATGVAAPGILFFDDAEENIAAATEQGWHACRVTDRQNPVAQMTLHLKRHNLI